MAPPTISTFSWVSLVLVILLGLLLTQDSRLPPFVNLPFRQHRQPDFSAADAIIIGGSHAGLSAALTLYRHQHTVLIFDDSNPRNVWDTPTHALSGRENVKASRYRAESRAELLRTGHVRFVDEKVESIVRMNESSYEITTARGSKWESKKVLLAMGAKHEFPPIPGYENLYPDRIFHCLFTFGFERRGSNHGAILAMGLAGSPLHTKILVQDAQKFAHSVSVYTNGDSALAAALQAQFGGSKAGNWTRVDDRKLVKLSAEAASQVRLDFEDGQSEVVDFLVHQPRTMVDERLVSQLGLELNERGDIVVRMPFYQTTVAGVFAAGDCASPFKIIANALLMGANAGAGMARELPRLVTENAPRRFL